MEESSSTAAAVEVAATATNVAVAVVAVPANTDHPQCALCQRYTAFELLVVALSVAYQDTNFDEHWSELASRAGMNSLLGTIITFWRIDGGPEGHMTLKISEFKEQLKSSETEYSSTGVFKLTIDFFKSEGDDGDSAAKRIEAMKVGDHTSIAFYQLSLIDNINAYTCSSREPFPEKKLRKAVLHAFEGYDYLRNHYVRLLQDDSMSPLAFIREVIVDAQKAVKRFGYEASHRTATPVSHTWSAMDREAPAGAAAGTELLNEFNTALGVIGYLATI